MSKAKSKIVTGKLPEIVVDAVPAQTGRGTHIVSSWIGERQLERDTFHLSQSNRRAQFIRKTLKAAFPNVSPAKWPPEVRKKLEADLLRFATVPPGCPQSVALTTDIGVTFHTTEGGYGSIDGSTYHVQADRRTKLANFVAHIVGEIENDDGAELIRELSLVVRLTNGREVVTSVRMDRFNSLDWVIEKVGPTFVIQPGQGVRDKLRCAIQEMSGSNIPRRTVYRHTGWRKIAGKWRYLHVGCRQSCTIEGGDCTFDNRGNCGDSPGMIGDCAVCTDCTVPPGIEVRLEGSAARYCLPDPPSQEQLRIAIRASLEIFELAPDRITFPLLATTYRAALGTADYSLWMFGRTGVYKSELAALAQQHYGPDMARDRLPGNWSSTENALEELAFTIKDALLVIDDFAPASSRHDADRQQRTAERMIRGQGNHSGRQRMRADCSARPTRPPRGLVLVTAEDMPRGHSIIARLFVVEVRSSDVSLARLSACQRDAAIGLYASAMAGFTAWLAPKYSDIQGRLSTERADVRNKLVGDYPHARTPEIVANLMIGLRYFLGFALDVGAINRDRHDELLLRGERAFLVVAQQQGEHHRETDPVTRFPQMIAAIISGGHGHVADSSGRCPEEPLNWGWTERHANVGTEASGSGYSARGTKIGWLHGEELLLDQDNTYFALMQFAQKQGQSCSQSKSQLFRRLKEEKMLLRSDVDRTTVRVTLEGMQRSVSAISPSLLSQEQCKPCKDEYEAQEIEAIRMHGGG